MAQLPLKRVQLTHSHTFFSFVSRSLFFSQFSSSIKMANSYIFLLSFYDRDADLDRELSCTVFVNGKGKTTHMSMYVVLCVDLPHLSPLTYLNPNPPSHIYPSHLIWSPSSQTNLSWSISSHLKLPRYISYSLSYLNPSPLSSTHLLSAQPISTHPPHLSI